MHFPPGRQLRVLAVILLVPLLSSCGTPPPTSLSATLIHSATLLAHAESIHMQFSTDTAPPSSVIAAESGSGMYEAPNSFAGSFLVGYHGIPLTVGIVVLGKTTYLKAPLAGHYTQGNPGAYGFPNPIAFFSTVSGFPALLRATSSLHYAGLTAQNGTLHWSISGSIPNTMLARILKTPDVPRTDTVTYVIDPHSGVLNSLSIRAPVYTASMLTAVNITLDYPATRQPITVPTS